MARRTRTLSASVIPLLQRTIRTVRTQPDPVVTARSMARGTTIIGLMLEEIGERRGWQRYAAWITRAGNAAWGLVEMAVPRSLGEILFQHWISLVYAIGAAMTVIGIIAGNGPVIRVGSVTLLVTALVHFAVDLIRQLMLHDRAVKAVVKPLFVLSMIGSLWMIYSLNALDTRIQKTSGFEHASLRAGQFVHPEDAAKLGPVENDIRLKNVRLMKQSLLLDTGFIVVYSVLILSGGLLLVWWAARWLPRPYRAFALLLGPVAVAATCDLLENIQAYVALSGIDTGLELPVSAIKLGSLAVAMAILAGLYLWAALHRPAA